jgi:drug/metabolite transporter (DMT)-like permease
MPSAAFILGYALLSVTGANLMRRIQAYAGDRYAAITSHYVAAFVLSILYVLLRGVGSLPARPLIVGMVIGVIGACTVLISLQNMAERGLAMTNAIGGMATMVPVLLAVGFGERPSSIQWLGIVVTAAALPFVSLATVHGEAIRAKPRWQFALLLFAMNGIAGSGNLLATKLVSQHDLPVYMIANFAAGLVVSAAVWQIKAGKARLADAAWGAAYGALSMGATVFVLAALTHVAGTVFFAGGGAVAMVANMTLAIRIWRERMQAWGWFGIGLASLACLMLNIPGA